MRDKADAVFRAAEARGIRLGVLADNQAFGDADRPVDNDIRQARAAPDLNFGQRNHAVQFRIGMGTHPGVQKALVQLRPGYDTATGDHGRNGNPPAVFLVVNELRRWGQFRIGPDRPALIVEVEFGLEIGQVDIGLPERVDRSDVAPIGGLFG